MLNINFKLVIQEWKNRCYLFIYIVQNTYSIQIYKIQI